jgi:CheY-like chemotaxis protein
MKPAAIQSPTKDMRQTIQEPVRESRMPQRASHTALIVDDDLASCELIQTILHSAKMEALISTDSSQAVGLLRDQKFDAIFLDVNMSSPDGFELTRLIRASGCNQKTTVIMITGDSDPSVLGRGFQAGANYFVFKPINKARLLNLSLAAYGAAQREKRHYQRVKVIRIVQVILDRDILEGETIDVSLNGLQVRAARTFAPGSQVIIRLYLSSGTQPITAHGKVVRLIGSHMAIHLENIAKDGSKRLQDFLLPLILALPKDTAARVVPD